MRLGALASLVVLSVVLVSSLVATPSDAVPAGFSTFFSGKSCPSGSCFLGFLVYPPSCCLLIVRNWFRCLATDIKALYQLRLDRVGHGSRQTHLVCCRRKPSRSDRQPTTRS